MAGFPLPGAYMGPLGKFTGMSTATAPTVPFGEEGTSDPTEDPLVGVDDGESSLVEDLPASGMVGTGPGEPDPAAGGSTVQDPAEAGKASSDKVNSPEPYDEQITVTANRSFPQIRGFTDRTFLLMHMHNLINLRNEPPSKAIEGESGDEKGDETMDAVAKNTLKSLKHPLPYAYYPTDANKKSTNAVVQLLGEPASFLNHILASPNYQRYIDSHTATLSSLTPKIRLYKLFHDDDDEQIVQFNFGTDGIAATELYDLVRSQGAKRGYGAGIKSFNLNFTGDNLATAKTTVEATLSIYANSMEELLKPRETTRLIDGKLKKLYYRYIDLAFVSTGARDATPTGAKGSLEDMKFEIVAEVGIAEEAASAISADVTAISAKLIPHTHNFDIGQDGSVTLTIDYAGYIQQHFGDPVRYDVFSTSESVTLDLFNQLGLHIVNTQCSGEQTALFKQRMAAVGNANYKNRIVMINNLLRNRGKIYYINIEAKVLEAFNTAFNTYEKTLKAADEAAKLGAKPTGLRRKAFSDLQAALGNTIPPLSTIEERSDAFVEYIAKEIENDMTETERLKSNISDCARDPNATQVAYFYVGDLINLILENLSELYEASNINKVIDDVERMVNGVFGDKDTTAQEEAEAGTELVSRGAEVTQDVLSTLGGVDDHRTSFTAVKKAFIAEAKRFKRFRAILGPTSISDFFGGDEIACSIGDIPVPLNHFNAWLAGEMEGTERTRFSLHQFLQKFINVYLRTYMKGDKELLDSSYLGIKRLYKQREFTAHTGDYAHEYDGNAIDPLTALRTEYGGRRSLLYEFVPNEQRPLIKTSTNRFLTKSRLSAFDYMVFYEERAAFTTPKDMTQFSNQGFNIYQHGRDRGIVKDIQYQKTDIPFRKESVFLGSMDGLMQIAEVFNATITTYADLETHIGQYIYIDPNSITPYLSKETRDSFGTGAGNFNLDMLGIGGFFVVTAVNHSFEPGKFETKLTANWVAHANSTEHLKSTDLEQTINEESEGSDPRRACKSVFEGDTSAGTGSKAVATAAVSDLFGSWSNKIIGFFKGLMDNSNEELTAEDLGAAFNAEYGEAARAARNPNQGTDTGAQNGPE